MKHITNSWKRGIVLTVVFALTFCLSINLSQVLSVSNPKITYVWDIPAWINEKPYIDASYTCLCPVIEMIDAGYKQVIAINNEPGVLYRDMFGLEIIPENYQGIDIHIIKPDADPKEMGVDFTNATPEGLDRVYQYGQEKGREFLAKWENS